MASNSASGYGVYSPAAIDPFPIESVLAKIVGDNNVGNAANLLGQYQVERQTSQGNYDYALGQQHDFAKSQLAAQIHENNLKALQEGSKNPGLLDLMNSPQYADVVAGIDPAVLQRVSTNLRNMQAAEQAQKGGSAAYEFTQAGAQPSTEQMTQLSGGLAGPSGTPLSTQNQILANNARLAAARIRAAGDSAPTRSVQVEGPFGKENISFGKGWSDQQMQEYLQTGRGIPRTYAPGQTPTGGAPLPDEAERLRQRGQGSPGTSAPPSGKAPAPPGPNKQMTQRPNNEEAGKAEYQTLVTQHLPTYEHLPMGKDIRLGMQKNGGRPLVARGPNGDWRPQGASGTVY